MKNLTAAAAALLLVGIGTTSAIASISQSTTGVGGYDLVSYHTGAKPLPGNGNHLSEIDGVVYLFASAENKATFDKDPQKYIPAFGGYCAYGVSVGKKFVGDPTVWEIVHGRLYLNLDNRIKGLWIEDVAGRIKKANSTWPGIRDKHFSEL